MKLISVVRDGLAQIPGALVETPPEFGYRGPEQGVEVSVLFEGDAAYPNRLEGAFLKSDDVGQAEGQIVPDFDPVFEFGPEVQETVEALGGKAGERIRKSVELHGMDALGWYSSFHVTGAQWGVYISVSGMAYMMQRGLSGLPVDAEQGLNLAFHAILNHELFHFATDYAVAQAELLFEEPWWLPAKQAFHKGKPSYCVTEEKLANAYMLKAFRTMKPALRVRGKQEALKRFTQHQPAGYREGALVEREGWEHNLTQLAECYRDHAARGSTNPHLAGVGAFDWPQLFPMRPRIDWRHCPIHLVHDGARLDLPAGWLQFISKIGPIVESKGFLRDLKKLSPSLQKRWGRLRMDLQQAITRGDDLKKWPKSGQNVWSVRVNKGFRAHLRKETDGLWTALAIGNHTSMGHG